MHACVLDQEAASCFFLLHNTGSLCQFNSAVLSMLSLYYKHPANATQEHRAVFSCVRQPSGTRLLAGRKEDGAM